MGFADTSNALFGTATPAGTLTVPSTPGGKSFSANGGVVTTLTGPYSLTDIGNYTLSGGGIITLTGGNVEVTPTPGPATMVMALAGLGTLAVGGWYRRARKPA
jgi:hypothetical protein